MHFHDLEPWGKQPLCILIGPEYCLQESGEPLPGLEAQSHQVLKFRQIGSQGCDQQLDRNRRLGRRAAASDRGQPDDEAIDFRPHPVGYFVIFLGGGGSEQGGGRRDQPIGRARGSHQIDDLRNAGIDQLEPLADLAKRVDAGRRGQHREGADPEECEQQPRPHSEIPAPKR